LESGKLTLTFMTRPWALQCWAPFAFLGMEINNLSTCTPSTATKSRGSNELTLSEKAAMYLDLEKDSIPMALNASPPQSTTGSGSDVSGVYLGILNLYTTLPQFVGTFISWTVFSILEPGKSPELAKHAHPDEHHGTDGPSAIAVCLLVGALAAMIAAKETKRLETLLS
jgi:solute carrier family 45 protein 1/2/4